MSGTFQDFIFSRELSEVYLLLDHISGRADKNLRDTPPVDQAIKPPDLIRQVCAIAWPPQGTTVERSVQAAALLDAKDMLNDRAQPATGATIAFTILVAETRNVRPFGGLRRMLTGGGKTAQLTTTASSQLSMGGGGPPLTRASLAEFAYPSLVPTATRFRRRIDFLLWTLIFGLILTCILSWNVSAGRAFLSRIDLLSKQKTELVAKLNTADLEEAKSAASDVSSVAAGGVLPYCERNRSAPPAAVAEIGPRKEQFKSVSALRVCAPLDDLQDAYRIAYADLADWVAPWRLWVNWLPRFVCNRAEGCLDRAPSEPPLTRNATDEQWGSVLVEVLANAVLPVLYGFLGAGAAVVRNLWGKMNDSLLSPRDFSLALAQLALGTLIGACIGLFVTPTAGQAANSPGLTGAVTLSASAMSFIAGFGVEGVFVALEGLIKRVFITK